MNEDSQHFEVAQPNAKAPLFLAEAYNNIEKSIVDIQLKDYGGKWIVLFFYPSNFTFV
jgi:alkyl hydroperoxide reductase subunit AhpC